MANSRNAVVLLTKIAIINAIEAGDRTKSEVAESFNLPKNTLSTILKNKVKLRKMFNLSKIDPGRKCMRQSTHEDLEEVLFVWFKQARTMSIPISAWSHFENESQGTSS